MVRNSSLANQIYLTIKPTKQTHGQKEKEEYYAQFYRISKRKCATIRKYLKKINTFLNHAPEGCLKWQNRNGKTYYYHQFMKDNKWVRRYIKKDELSLAKKLAQKHYYISIRPILEKMLDEIKRFTKKSPSNGAGGFL